MALRNISRRRARGRPGRRRRAARHRDHHLVVRRRRRHRRLLRRRGTHPVRAGRRHRDRRRGRGHRRRRQGVEAADIDGIDGLLATTTSTGTLEAPQHDAAVPQVPVVELDVAAARGFGADPAITGLDPSEPLAADGILVNRRTAEQLGVPAGDSLRLHAYGSTVDLEVSQVAAEVGLAGYGGAIVAPGHAGRPRRAPAMVAAAPQDAAADLPRRRVFDTRDLSDAVVTDLRDGRRRDSPASRSTRPRPRCSTTRRARAPA